MFFPQQCWRRTHGRCRTAVGLSITGAEGARLVRVWVSARVMIGTVADARGGLSSRRGGRGRHSIMVTRSRLLVTLFRVCCNRRCVCFDGLGFGVIHARDRSRGFFFLFLLVVWARGFVLAMVSDHACLPTSTRLTEFSEVRVQTAARVNERVSTLFE